VSLINPQMGRTSDWLNQINARVTLAFSRRGPVVDPEAWDAPKIAQVAREQQRIVSQRRGRDPNVHRAKAQLGFFKHRGGQSGRFIKSDDRYFAVVDGGDVKRDTRASWNAVPPHFPKGRVAPLAFLERHDQARNRPRRVRPNDSGSTTSAGHH
jgi:hypothetical protein